MPASFEGSGDVRNDSILPRSNGRRRNAGGRLALGTVIAAILGGAAAAQDPAGLTDGRTPDENDRRVRQHPRVERQEMWLRAGEVLINVDGRVVVRDAAHFESSMDQDLIPPAERLERIEIDPRLRELVSRLNAPEFDVRQRATAEIADGRYPREQIYAMLARDELSIEQRHRLLTVLQETVLNAPRGAVGISMREHRANDGGIEVLVTDLLPGLPAEQVMRIGDRIRAINGRDVESQRDLINRVQVRRPGDTVTMSVRRPKLDPMGREIVDDEGRTEFEMLEIDLTLGSAELLVNPVTGQPQTNSNIELLRRQEVIAAERRFGSSAREIKVDGEWPEVASSAVTALDELVENHPAVRVIREHRRMIAEGRLVKNQTIRQHWQLLLTEVKSRLTDPDLSPDTQQYLERVVQRVAQLIQ